MIRDGSVVRFEYTLSGENGEVIESNKGKDPIKVPKTKIPAAAQKVGTALNARGSEGKNRVVHVSAVKQESVILDFNHPLAGKTLNFDVKVLAIQPGES